MEFEVRRPQKPFAVEVKRGKKSVASVFPAIKSKQPATAAFALAEAKFAAGLEQKPELEQARPQRRILESIAPAPVAPSVIAVISEAPLAEEALADLPKRRRGRPPKLAGAKPDAARAPRREPVFFKPAARQVLRAADQPVALVAPPREAKASATPGNGHGLNGHGHVTHEARAEQAGELRRGDRWKRRLPKVLW
jgi:hypothetical protein